MQGSWIAVVFIVALLAGCANAPEPAPGQEIVSTAPSPTFTGVSYSCPGATPGPQPCGTWSPTFAAMAIIDVAFRTEPPLVAMVGSTLAAGLAGTAAPVEPAMALLTSTDDGATWSASTIPSIEDDANSRTGRASPYWASVEFTPDGALHLLMQVQGDVERNIIGGAVPDQLQSNNDIAFVSSRDDGRTWAEPVLLSDDPASSYSSSLSILADGTLFATWTDYPQHDFLTAWSPDGASWTFGAPTRADCRNPTPALELDGRILTACQDDINAFESTGQVMVLSSDRSTGTVEKLELLIGDDEEGGFPGCGDLQMLGGRDGLLLVLSRCPDIRLYASANGTAWTALPTLTPESLGLQEGWGTEGLWAESAALDKTGALHLTLWAERLGATIVETRLSHEVVAPADGALLHEAVLWLVKGDDPAVLASLPTNTASLSPAQVGFHEDAGYLLWRDGRTRFGWFDVAAAP